MPYQSTLHTIADKAKAAAFSLAGTAAVLFTLETCRLAAGDNRLEEERTQRLETAAQCRIDAFIHGSTNFFDERDAEHATPEQRAALAELID
jgi:hypothetical protein